MVLNVRVQQENMELITQNLGIYVSVYVLIVFLVPWLVFAYWVIKFHFAVRKVMGTAYTPWAAFKYAPNYAAVNKEFGRVFSIRNKLLLTVLGIWGVGFIVLAGFLYYVGY